MPALTPAEKKWLKKLQTVLNECPSERFGAYTVGDADITVFDQVKLDKWLETNPALHAVSGEFCDQVEKAGAFIQRVEFPFSVESTSG
jgi:hypothetical protein